MATQRKVSRRRGEADALDAQIAAENQQQSGAAELPAQSQQSNVSPVLTAAVPVVPPVAAAPAVSVEPAVDWQGRYAALEAQRAADLASFQERESGYATQLEADRAQTQRQLDALTAQVSEHKTHLEAERERVRKFEREKTFEVNLDGLEHISTDAARELQDKVFRPVLNRIVDDRDRQISELRDQLTQRDQRIDQGFGKIEQDTVASQRARTNRRVLAAHPDFTQVTTTQEFAQFKQARIPGSRNTWGAEMAAAYEVGDADYVNEALAAFKASRGAAPSLAQVAGAAPGTAGTTVASQPAAVAPKFSYTDLDKWKAQRRRGEITRAQELGLIKAFHAAEEAGEVQ